MGILTALIKHQAKLRSEAKTQIKAEVKAAKAQAKEEARRQAHAEKRRNKLLARQEKTLLRQQNRGAKAKQRHEKQMAQNALNQIRAGRFNKERVLRYVSATRVLAPVALPLIYRGITLIQQQFVSAKARRLKVSPEQLSRFSGHGAALQSRIAGVSSSLEQTGLPEGFVQDAHERLTQLSAAVDNAEYMTVEQRRRTHSSISADIDALTGQIEQRLTQR